MEKEKRDDFIKSSPGPFFLKSFDAQSVSPVGKIPLLNLSRERERRRYGPASN
jgi:hypothetical protein